MTMRLFAIAAALLAVAASAVAEDIPPLVADPSGQPAPAAKVSATRRALDMQRRAEPPGGTAQDMTGEEARRLSDRRTGGNRPASPSPQR